MKILALVSAIDLAEPPRATLFWWQLFKNMSAIGVEVIVVPFIGRDVESPWWTCYPNPAYQTAKLAYKTIKRSKKRSANVTSKSFAEKVHADIAVGNLISGKWEKNVEKILKKEINIDIVIAFSIPIKPLERLFRLIKQRGQTLIYYEADMPEVLPEYNTFGYSYYKKADLSMFDGFLSNSEGVAENLQSMGARNVGTLHYAVDPEFYSVQNSAKKVDVLFSGAGSTGRGDLLNKMIIGPSSQSSLHFGVSGVWKSELPKNITQFGFVPFRGWLRLNSSSHITLDVARRGHADVEGTSTYRLFELCGLGCTVVTNKRKGIEKWYEPRKEIYVLEEDENPLEVYEQLLSDKEALLRMGSLAHERTLKNHTCMHRALELTNYVNTL